MSYRIGIRVHREQPPEALLTYVRTIEDFGFDDAWVVEDLGYGGGLTAAASALAATSRLQVGIGILAAVVRNPAYLAMELATLERMHPGRLVAGIGHGVQAWMTAVGVKTSSPLSALRETLTSVQGLLDAATVTQEGRTVRLAEVQLAFPPRNRPAVLAGVRGPKSLALAGSVCDGALLAEPATPGYVTWARSLLESAAAAASRSRPELAVYTWFSVDDDFRVARERIRPALATNLTDTEVGVHLTGLDFGDELSEWITAAGDSEHQHEAIKSDWIGQLGVVGTPGECADAVRALANAGADRVILLPVPGHESAQLERFTVDVRPLLP